MKIAVEGCCHGELDKIYETLEYLEKKENVKVDLLLICGDFQAVRNRSDLQAMAVPSKYQKMNTFWKYYSGEKKPPVLTVFVGGNHEASNYLQELPYGGWVAPDIYYMGYANIVQFGGIRIAGLSGIYKSRDYCRGHHECPPYTEDTKRSAYHVRSLEVFRFKQVTKPIDIFMSHDWPRGIYNFGNLNSLLYKKRFLQQEVEEGSLGSPPSEELLFKLKPDYWFAAHLHVKFAALVEHEGGKADGNKKFTKFLSLDKCLPRRNFLQILDIPHNPDKSLKLELDPEWLCILKSTNHLLNLGKGNSYMPGLGCGERYDFRPTPEELAAVEKDFDGIYAIPENFEQTAPKHDPSQGRMNRAPAPHMCINPQTTLMCEMLSLTNPFSVFTGQQQHAVAELDTSSANASFSLNVTGDSDFIDTTAELSAVNSTLETTANPDEISLDDIDEQESEAEEPVQAPPVQSPGLCLRGKLCMPPLNSTPNQQKPEGMAHTDACTKESKLDLGGFETQFRLDDSKAAHDEPEELSSATSPPRSDSESSGKRSGNDVNTTCPGTLVPKVKKLKRRNESLYSSNCTNSESDES